MSNTRPRRQPPQQQPNNELGAAALAAGGSLIGGAGGTTITSCPADDNSFYCQFVKGFNIFKMILFIIVIAVVGYFIYTMFFSGNGSKGSARRR